MSRPSGMERDRFVSADGTLQGTSWLRAAGVKPQKDWAARLEQGAISAFMGATAAGARGLISDRRSRIQPT